MASWEWHCRGFGSRIGCGNVIRANEHDPNALCSFCAAERDGQLTLGEAEGLHTGTGRDAEGARSRHGLV